MTIEQLTDIALTVIAVILAIGLFWLVTSIAFVATLPTTN